LYCWGNKHLWIVIFNPIIAISLPSVRSFLLWFVLWINKFSPLPYPKVYNIQLFTQVIAFYSLQTHIHIVENNFMDSKSFVMKDLLCSGIIWSNIVKNFKNTGNSNHLWEMRELLVSSFCFIDFYFPICDSFTKKE
jgi:hypothetical protein